MVRINCNYTGRIPGIGKGPLVGVQISENLLKQLQAQGFFIEVINTPKEERAPSVRVIPSVAHSTEPASKFPAAVPPKIEETDETKAEESAKEKLGSVSGDKITEEYLNTLDDEELKKLLPKDIKLPPRFGKAWLIKNILKS